MFGMTERQLWKILLFVVAIAITSSFILICIQR
jgi:hypothetical protein